MQAHKKRPNVHAAFHLYNFLLSFGPVISWWCFPFECLIGSLQKINTNYHIGGELEVTMLQSFMKAANLCCYLNRPDCPQHMWDFKHLLDKALRSKDQKVVDFKANLPMLRQTSHVYYMYCNVIYSWASTHLRGSLVCYYCHSASSELHIGSIQEIRTEHRQVSFKIWCQAPLPSSKYDPIQQYPDFPAMTYSSLMVDGPLDSVHPKLVHSHVTCYEFLNDQAVILDLCRVSTDISPISPCLTSGLGLRRINRSVPASVLQSLAVHPNQQLCT
ncbi:hypothetical protein EDD18DRAFT_1077960 [Armillaria luteobubalina]|uniref:Uncharacterized protein n=1 Tax=Armillaria luteobubalina TaxID=153913 RepID=A0AA39UM52_9AGAR|nr:hypothetical protein EDD18DRAFT_1077960 [Armillaria luteobubalina]